jgi:uncharacterized protein
MDKILNYIVTSIVEKPEEVKITSDEQEDGVINLGIEVADEDMGRIIGKNGKVIKAIRNIIKIPSIKQNKRVYVSLVEKPQQ